MATKTHEPERMSVQFSIRDADLEKNTFRGMASVFNNLIDAWMPTRILPGAFTKTLAENQKRIKVLYQHNPDWPIGRPTRMEENEDGLYVEAKISQTSMGNDCLVLLRDKVLTELSIGFDPVRSTMVDESLGGVRTQVRHISEVQLWEFSPVTFGANSKALISAVNNRGVRSSVDDRLAALDAQWASARNDQLHALDMAALDAGIRMDVSGELAELNRLAASIRRR